MRLLAAGGLLLAAACTAGATHPRRAPPPGRPEPGLYNERVLGELQRCEPGDPGRPLAGAVVCRCDREAGGPGLASVELTLAIGEGGRVARAVASPDSALASCLRSALPDSFVSDPPSSPWILQVKTLTPGTVLTH